MSLATTAKRTYEMLENQSLWDTAAKVHQLLVEHQIDHAIVGGVAVCLHGYRRNTVDIDLLLRPEQAAAAKAALESTGFEWNAESKELKLPSGVGLHFVLTGESEGPGQPAKFPDPGDTNNITRIEDLPVLSLAALIQAKLACGLGDLRRTHKDFADVVELIAIHRLDGSYARHLHKSVQPEFRELVRRVGSAS